MQRHAGGLLSFVVYLVVCVCGGGGTLDVWSYPWPQLEVSQQKKGQDYKSIISFDPWLLKSYYSVIFKAKA